VPITLKQSKESNMIRLEGVIDIASAAELKKLLLTAFNSGREVRVALGGATDLDVTAVQLLWAARRQAKVSGVNFAFTGQMQEQVTSALRQAGFTDVVTSEKGNQVSGVKSCQP
jgi:anti-anti-sigma factor